VLFGSWRRKGVYVGEKQIASPGSYPVAGFNFAPMYNLNYKLRFGVSLDGVYDGSANVYTEDALVEYDAGSGSSRRKFLVPGIQNQLALGLSGRAEYVMPFFTIGVGLGTNVLGRGDLRGLYQVFALKINVTRSSFLHIGYNLQSAVSSFVGTISTWDQFGINFADWNRLMNLEEEPEGDEDCIDKIHEIEMKNVEFRYPQRSESAVKNINLRILTGEKIAIVGENGSGKTTLLYLLLGIYRPISGEASVNGKTMELNLDNYRKKTACLIQNFVHFQMTLRENLAPNDFSELSEDPLIDFANNFPDRLNTFLGALDSNGVELSGGQWKRIALYRTLHKKDVDLIVLDEPTANLDPKISENIINRLLKPNYNKTVIVITHDFELAKKFDRIIGMKEGKIICDSPPQAFAWELFEKHNSDKRSLPQIG
jgi:ABC-type multidrug transport system fused ATPase/permease subunit